MHQVNAPNPVSTSQMFPLQNINVHTASLESYNWRYTEKQIKRLDENIYDYYLGSKISLPSATSHLHLFEKYFSGDLSGLIPYLSKTHPCPSDTTYSLVAKLFTQNKQILSQQTQGTSERLLSRGLHTSQLQGLLQ
jgi:hypothetical protein